MSEPAEVNEMSRSETPLATMRRIEAIPLDRLSITLGEGEERIVLLIKPVEVVEIGRSSSDVRGIERYLDMLFPLSSVGRKLDLTYQVWVYCSKDGYSGIGFVNSVSPTDDPGERAFLHWLRNILRDSRSADLAKSAVEGMYVHTLSFRRDMDKLSDRQYQEKEPEDYRELQEFLIRKYGLLDSSKPRGVIESKTKIDFLGDARVNVDIKDRQFVKGAIQTNIDMAKLPYQPPENPMDRLRGYSRQLREVLEGTDAENFDRQFHDYPK